MDDSFSLGIAIDKISLRKSDFTEVQQYIDASQSHRDEGHTFHVVIKGSLRIEIDFEEYQIKAPAMVYMHPQQAHRIITFNNITVCTLAMTSENLHPEFLNHLNDIAPAKPLALTSEDYLCIADLISVCMRLSALKNNRLYHFILRDSCNSLVGMLIEHFLHKRKFTNNLSRAELIAGSFKQLLEQNYCTLKRPADYARKLNISVPYLNESLKKVTGLSVTRHIQERILLEAKRLLHHTSKSVKEIAAYLGYDDYPYFSRLFTRFTGMSALAFRNKNND